MIKINMFSSVNSLHPNLFQALQKVCNPLPTPSPPDPTEHLAASSQTLHSSSPPPVSRLRGSLLQTRLCSCPSAKLYLFIDSYLSLLVEIKLFLLYLQVHVRTKYFSIVKFKKIIFQGKLSASGGNQQLLKKFAKFLDNR